ncbi:MAG: efflux RND transporter permease subunit [Magnetococcus sp. WYHC-3]
MKHHRGVIAWFIHHGVSANLLMVVIVLLGLHALYFRLPLEVFPSFALDVITISVPFPGAAPAEVEEGVIIRIEEAISSLDGIREISSTATEGTALISLSLGKGEDPATLLADVKSRVEGLTTLPEDAETPVIQIAENRREVISLAVHGHVPETDLRHWAEKIRDQLLRLPGITQVDLVGARPYELSIEIPQDALRRHGLTLRSVGQALKAASLDLPGGTLRTPAGDLLVRTKGQAYTAREFAAIPILTRPDGTRLTLGEVAVIRDGFEENQITTTFNGRRSLGLDIYQVGDQNAVDIARAVREHVAGLSAVLPAGIEVGIWRDRSSVVKARLATLSNNAIQGSLLVLLLLTLFLHWKLAFWVFLGIPVSMLGALAVMPFMEITINTVSLFAFILVLGIVVDDAIVTGESIYTRLVSGADPVEAAVRGTREVAVPVTFGVLTTVVSFLPLFMVEGDRGKIFAQIPAVIVPVLLISLVESKLVLPSHLKHLRLARHHDHPPWHERLQAAVAGFMEGRLLALYRPLLALATRHRHVVLALFVAQAVVVFALVAGGHVHFVFFPRVQSEIARATLTLPPGTAFEVTQRHIQHMAKAAEELRDQYRDPITGDSVILDILALAGSSGGSGSGQPHEGRVYFEIQPPEERTSTITSQELVNEWRRRIGPIPGARNLNFRAELGRGGDPIDVQLTGENLRQLQHVAEQVKAELRNHPGLFDIADSFEFGKREVRLRLTPQGESLGLTLAELAAQVRAAFHGFEVQKIQRERHEVTVMLHHPESERRSAGSLETLLIRTPAGDEVPFAEVAMATWDHGFSKIQRLQRQRTLHVTADLNKQTTDAEAIKRDMARFLERLLPHHPGVQATLEGEAREQRESLGSMKIGLVFVLVMLYVLLAIPFNSGWQPLLVMSVIPFAAVGAILGHLLLDMSLSIYSLMGALALLGVAVNDSLVMVDYINRRREEGMPLHDAVRQAGTARFRAVLLTSLTTFAGLVPLILEKSTQAQFLIPMAVSLGFGILYVTFVTLLLIPCNYLLLEDLGQLARRLWRGPQGGGPLDHVSGAP